jgi:hypothetical protein
MYGPNCTPARPRGDEEKEDRLVIPKLAETLRIGLCQAF